MKVIGGEEKLCGLTERGLPTRLGKSLHGSLDVNKVVSGRGSLLFKLIYQHAAFPPSSSCSRRDKPAANAASISIEIYCSFTK